MFAFRPPSLVFGASFCTCQVFDTTGWTGDLYLNGSIIDCDRTRSGIYDVGRGEVVMGFDARVQPFTWNAARTDDHRLIPMLCHWVLLAPLTASTNELSPYSPISRPSKVADCPLSLPSDNEIISPDLSTHTTSIPIDGPYKGLKWEMVLNVARRKWKQSGPEASV
ncbi:hypothetical protein BJY52DRAFT_1229086 [Lactarius psammicola]|nr:hypothetical protein BJY52DRAFT_1229086 [Lactarius psammicola]